MKDLSELELQLKIELQNELIDFGFQYLKNRMIEKKTKNIQIGLMHMNIAFFTADLIKDSSEIILKYPTINESSLFQEIEFKFNEYDLML